MTIDYNQLKALVKEAMFTGGGINEPSAPEGIPHRMPSADTTDKEQDMGDPEANNLYAMAVEAREGVEELIVALDAPIFDAAYEHAFKASACLRNAINTIEQAGAHPMPDQRVAAPPRDQQKYNAGGIGPGAGTPGFVGADFGLEENLESLPLEVQQAVIAYKKLGEEELELFQTAISMATAMGGEGN
tara:strand:+ start:1696 stop:2259 length:564 start_codon:yes stop_codon:yes gene_type:complete